MPPRRDKVESRSGLQRDQILTEAFFEISFTGEFIRLSFTRSFTITPHTAHELLASLAAQCSAHACTKVLVEGLSPAGGLSTEELYNLGVALSRAVPGIRVAVFLEGQARSTDREFFKDVATNRGANVRYFSTAAAGAEWLAAL
jgi:hypothetical protein